MSAYCHVTLAPVPASSRVPGYTDTGLKRLFGTLRVTPELPFTRSEFFQQSRARAQGMSISGVQQKLSVRLDDDGRIVPTTVGGTHILKPSPEAYPNAAENEHAAMEVCRRLGIATADCALMAFPGGELAYLTRRFDRVAEGKCAQEDLTQCGRTLDQALDKYAGSYESAARLVDVVTGGKRAAVLELAKRIVVAYLIGNDDMHLKNIAVIRAPTRRAKAYDGLTPTYDQLFCGAYPTASRVGYLALDLLDAEAEGTFSDDYQRTGGYTGADFLSLAARTGLPTAAVRNFITKTIAKSDEITELVSRSYMPGAMKAECLALLRERYRALDVRLGERPAPKRGARSVAR